MDLDKVQESALVNFKKIMSGKSGKFFSGVFQKQCKEVAFSEQRPKKKYDKLIEIVSEASTYIAPHSSCGKGCHHCCHMAVTITGYEAQVIGKHLGIEPTPVPTDHEAIARKSHESIIGELRDKYMGQDCPFLKEGSCTVYEVRPFACRAYFNISNDSSVCDLTLGANDVPSVDMRVFWMAQTTAFLQYEFGDIREFFPPVQSVAK